MSIKTIISEQYREKMNKVGEAARDLKVPPEGWICTARKALGMSAAQPARRLGVSRALISNTEQAELAGRVTIRTLQTMAEAMGYQLVYAVVPKEKVEDMLTARADLKARRRVEEAHKQMALEKQALSQNQIDSEINRLRQDLLINMPSDFWDDKL